MADKAVELLDQVISDGDHKAFIKGIFVAQRNNPAILNKVQTGILYRLSKTSATAEDRKKLREARDALHRHLAILSGGGTVTAAAEANREFELKQKAEGTTPPAEPEVK